MRRLVVGVVIAAVLWFVVVALINQAAPGLENRLSGPPQVATLALGPARPLSPIAFAPYALAIQGQVWSYGKNISLTHLTGDTIRVSAPGGGGFPHDSLTIVVEKLNATRDGWDNLGQAVVATPGHASYAIVPLAPFLQAAGATTIASGDQLLFMGTAGSSAAGSDRVYVRP